MLKSALIAVAVIAVAAPGLAMAKGKKAAEEVANGPSAPIPYSQLAEEDAKLNGTGAKHHVAKKKAEKKADAPAAAAPAK
jgi:hypothetical protein